MKIYSHLPEGELRDVIKKDGGDFDSMVKFGYSLRDKILDMPILNYLLDDKSTCNEKLLEGPLINYFLNKDYRSRHAKDFYESLTGRLTHLSGYNYHILASFDKEGVDNAFEIIQFQCMHLGLKSVVCNRSGVAALFDNISNNGFPYCIGILEIKNYMSLMIEPQWKAGEVMDGYVRIIYLSNPVDSFLLTVKKQISPVEVKSFDF